MTCNAHTSQKESKNDAIQSANEVVAAAMSRVLQNVFDANVS